MSLRLKDDFYTTYIYRDNTFLIFMFYFSDTEKNNDVKLLKSIFENLLIYKMLSSLFLEFIFPKLFYFGIIVTHENFNFNSEIAITHTPK